MRLFALILLVSLSVGLRGATLEYVTPQELQPILDRLDALELFHEAPPPTGSEIIVDNTDANTTSVGTWKASAASGFIGSNSVWNDADGSFRASHRSHRDRSTSRICVRSDSVTWCCTKTAPGKRCQRNSHNFRHRRTSINGASSNRRPGCPRRFSSRSRINSSRRSGAQATKMREFAFSI